MRIGPPVRGICLFIENIMSYFEELGLAEPILRALKSKGYTDPTPIQKQAIPALLKGRDLCGIAQTGTGKTAAFSLPSLDYLASNAKEAPHKGCRMLILSPTRELAAQIADNMREYARFLKLSVTTVFGGVPINRQIRQLSHGVDVLVATPGRLLDLIEQRALRLDNVEIFVLDEADQMMDLGFIVPLKRIDKLLPKDRQSLFFSATMPKAIAELGARFLNNPVQVSVAPQSTTAERVEQYVTHVQQKEKQALLTLRLQALNGEQALVFTRTKHGADRVVRHLMGAGLQAAAIHGNKSQGQRTAALQGFRQKKMQILVATDIAARGIDISDIGYVFNYEIPNVAEQYVHRIGRTARAGAEGVAISFVAPDEKPYIRDIQKLTGVKLTPMALPDDFIEKAKALPGPAKKPSGDGGGRGRGGRSDGRSGARSGARADSGRAGARGGRQGGNRSGNRDRRPDRSAGAERSERSERGPRSDYNPAAFREKGEDTASGNRSAKNRHTNDRQEGNRSGGKGPRRDGQSSGPSSGQPSGRSHNKPGGKSNFKPRTGGRPGGQTSGAERSGGNSRPNSGGRKPSGGKQGGKQGGQGFQKRRSSN
jgi:ATP-dependent RNA helicase RhlE